MHLDAVDTARTRAGGPGWQSRINTALRHWLKAGQRRLQAIGRDG